MRLLTMEAKRRQRRTDIQDSMVAWAVAAGYTPAAHHERLIAELELLESDPEVDVLMVFMPPGSGKSIYTNHLFPAWYVARHPDRNVLTASHSSELAERFGRKTRNLIVEHGQDLGVSLSDDSQAANRWATTAGGEYYAVGVGVGIAGFRADLGIIDDPFGSREDAESRRMRDRTWDWYSDDFSTRLKPGAKKVIMHTRWHDDDLAGRVIRQLDAIGRPYRLLSLPAQAGLGDPLGRQIGEWLWDDGDYGYGAQLRRRKEEVDTRTWASLYQQVPVPEGGAYFERDWIRPSKGSPAREGLNVYGASDYAVTRDGGDYTVHIVVGLDPGGNMHVLDLWRKQADSAEWIDAWCDLVKKWRPLEWAEEMGQIRASLGPMIDAAAREKRAYVSRRQFPTRGDKAVRAQSIRARMSMRGLYIPHEADWRKDFEAELLRFPAGVHDDQVDALGLIG
ncbi:phage terminase large subunit, partial [Methylobacterium sp. J-030]|uniref:phage terminase large subunit n=1 Tax=Methylobacterium sp. J-030 TaxID=2836627 RepID=UPI001FB9B348